MAAKCLYPVCETFPAWDLRVGTLLISRVAVVNYLKDVAPLWRGCQFRASLSPVDRQLVPAKHQVRDEQRQHCQKWQHAGEGVAGEVAVGFGRVQKTFPSSRRLADIPLA
jgi:hypothetical protein